MVYVTKDLFRIPVTVSVKLISYDVGLDYENSKCRKKLVDELVADCTENIDEVKIAALDYITLLYFVNKLPLCPQCLSVTICSQ